MALSLTITGNAGPGEALSAQVFTEITELKILPDTNIIEFVKDGYARQVDITDEATVTATKSGTTWTLTIS